MTCCCRQIVARVDAILRATVFPSAHRMTKPARLAELPHEMPASGIGFDLVMLVQPVHRPRIGVAFELPMAQLEERPVEVGLVAHEKWIKQRRSRRKFPPSSWALLPPSEEPGGKSAH